MLVINIIKTIVYLYQVVIYYLKNIRVFYTYVAPTINNSVDLALVESDNTVIKILIIIIIIISRAVRLSK